MTEEASPFLRLATELERLNKRSVRAKNALALADIDSWNIFAVQIDGQPHEQVEALGRGSNFRWGGSDLARRPTFASFTP